jgi:hypothetical protein
MRTRRRIQILAESYAGDDNREGKLNDNAINLGKRMSVICHAN